MTEQSPSQPSPGPAAPDRRHGDERRRGAGIAAAAVVLALVAAVALSRSSAEDPGAGEVAAPPGTRTFDDLARDHVPGRVSYPQMPPVGGEHNSVWQNCGFYQEPIVTERGVHTLEHGAVWITYRPDLPAGQVTSLQRLAEDQTYILVSPWPDGLPAPVVASAWGGQLNLPSADDPNLADFVRAFRLSPDGPEPGAPCTGGKSAAQ